MLVFEILQGLGAGRRAEMHAERATIGRRPDCQLVLEEAHVSGEHARVTRDGARCVLVDLGSTNGTTLVRGGARLRVGGEGAGVDLEAGDVIELGTGDAVTALRVTFPESDADDARVLAVTRLDAVRSAVTALEGDPGVLTRLYALEKRIGAAADLDAVLVEVADAALELVPQATHATIVLRDDDLGTEDAPVFVPMRTRVRRADGTVGAPDGPVPVTRSVHRKVVRERAAVLAADAPSEVGASDSMLGASIQSTIGVPLWRGEDVVGVLQLDNRHARAVLTPHDVELLLLLASNASLAVASARLIKRLVFAEEQLRRENSFLKGREERRRGASEVEIIGESAAMRAVMQKLDKVVDTRVTVLVEGETGTGKELVAAALHYRSRRRGKLFVAQNCAALAETLLESELFGHKRGAFTGASEEKKGLFEIADGGTLFLDEINSTSLALQSKLLRALQEGEIRQVGATQAKHVDVRIVAATNKDLESLVKEGSFREDLFYRLQVFPLRLPPLRERRDDIPLLAGRFLERYGAELGKPAGGFSQQALELLTAYDWPGNVRELQNEVQRIVIQVEPGAFVTPDLLSPHVRRALGVVAKAGVAKGTLRDMMDTVEKYLLLETLREHGGNKTSAARTLGITREGLHKKLRQFGI